ncbi:MAG: amidophosphoribosyltransferase [Bacteroidales bacterium]|nr:amidophosphoribosyltransferase [Bacteroidales bacterium]
MSDAIKHECGIAFLRLLRPQEFYLSKYGTSTYGVNKLYLLMEKQHNRGQDGAGMASLKLGVEPGKRYIDRYRSNGSNPIKEIFSGIYSHIDEMVGDNSSRLRDIDWLKSHVSYTGEVFMGHLRYGTYGKNDINSVHPFIRHNNWMTRNLVLSGNFNLTNVHELFDNLVNVGQHPVETTDTITVMEKIGHFLDRENESLYKKFKEQGYSKKEISGLIASHLDVLKIISRSAKQWDGGYTISGMIGHGDAFVMRDPSGIRPAYYYKDDEVVVATSERPVIQTAFNVSVDKIHEIEPGHLLIVRQNGDVIYEPFQEPGERRSCSFERIYFSRGTDRDIYQERKKLGKALANPILKKINHNLENSVFSYIPNTASVAFNGLVEELNNFCDNVKVEKIKSLKQGGTEDELRGIMSLRPRVEQVAVKDAKMRTFITQDNQRDELVAHVYDVTYGVVHENDTLVVVDDSIVRGTTLKQSIIRILDRLKPAKIVIASSAPQIRYPDCYGIDMAKLTDFAAFKAAVALLKEKNMHHVIHEVYRMCKSQENEPKENVVNHVKEIYKPFTAVQISEKIAEILKPANVKAKIEIVYQSIEDLHDACPNDNGDWYFTGNYPTSGGNQVVNKSFINYIEGRDQRAY